MSNENRVFISHSSKDKKLADAFVDLLTSGLNINSNEIFCTSLEGLGITTGKNFIDFIKDKIEDSEAVISILSKNYYESAFCLCELGASWVISGEHMPILVPPMQFSDIEDVMEGLHGRKIDSGSDLSEIKDELEDLLDLNVMKTARWESKKDQFLRKATKIIPKLPKPEKVPFEEHSELQGKYDENLEDIETLEEELKEKEEIIKELKGCKDREEVLKVVKKYSDLDEEFESLIHETRKSIKKLAYIVIEALYYHFRDETLPLPSPYDEDRYEDIKIQLEYEYLCGDFGDDHEVGSISVCEDNPKIEIAIVALSELRSFIWRVMEEDIDDDKEQYEDFVSDYREEHGFNLSFKSRRFWEEHLDI